MLFRSGGSAWGASVWRSDSGLVCRAVAGHVRDHGVLASAGVQRGSVSGAASYNAPSVSSVAGSNGVSSGSIFVTAVGVGFVSYGSSSRVRVGGSAALSTVWISGSSVVARCGAGLGGGVSVAVSFGVQAGGLSLALSYNAATVSSVSLLEVAVSGASLVDIYGNFQQAHG